METKKKYHGGLKVLLLPLFIMLLGICSTSYALTPSNQITDYGTQQLFDYFYSVKDNYVQDNWNKMNNFNSFYSNLQVSSVTQTLNSTFTTWATTFPNLEQITFSLAVDNNSNYRLIAIQNNNTIGDTLPFIRLNGQVYSSSSNYSPTFIDDLGNNISGTTLLFTFNTNGTLTYNGYQNTISNLSYKLSPLFNKIENTDTANIWNFVSFGNNTYYLKSNNNDTLSWVWNTNRLYNIEPIPEPTPTPQPQPGGTITNPSGDITGTINLQPIENSLNNIENKIPTSGDIQNIISGETTKIINTFTNVPVDTINNTVITSGDIERSLGFDFMADPYANFWFEMINGLRGSLTGSVRQLPIDWLGYQGVFDLDSLGFNYPDSVRLILTSVSTVSMVWLLVKWWKIIVDKLTSGNMDEVLQMNEEERNSRLILKGV